VTHYQRLDITVSILGDLISREGAERLADDIVKAAERMGLTAYGHVVARTARGLTDHGQHDATLLVNPTGRAWRISPTHTHGATSLLTAHQRKAESRDELTDRAPGGGRIASIRRAAPAEASFMGFGGSATDYETLVYSVRYGGGWQEVRFPVHPDKFPPDKVEAAYGCISGLDWRDIEEALSDD
jgi:hypothetical protein